MPYIELNCLPTIIGSMPHTDPVEACAQVIHYLKDIPAWPQLPKRSFLENMYVQYSDGCPGVVLDLEKERIYVDSTQDVSQPLEKLYSAYLENDVDKYPIGMEYAAGLHAFLSHTELSSYAVKGQITGPVTWGATVADEDKKAVIWDDTLSDAVAKLLRLKAGWMERELKKLSDNTIIFIDEPYMQSYGSSSFVALSREKVISLLNEVLGGISGLKGVHCCGNTDWSVIFSTDMDILSFDTYSYAESLSLYPTEVRQFLNRHGIIAWGIVPNEEDTLIKETVSSLKDRLEEAMAPFTRNGVSFRQLVKQSMLTPSCSLAGLPDAESSARTLELLAELSMYIRKRYI